MNLFSQISFVEIFSSFVVMFAIIDVLGSIPIFLSMREKGEKISPIKAMGVALLLFVGFFIAGDGLLSLFGVDIASFAVAGSFVIFVLALEMVLGIEIMKNEGGGGGPSIVPIAFPLIAGPGALTALLSLRAEYAVVNIMLGLLINIIFDYFVLRSVDKVGKLLGANIIFIVRKFFGVLLLAIAVKMFASNLAIVIAGLAQ
ncbi:MAG: MarC family protein [Bacteroidales bacterium]|nr:MarC family protein [Bacteroidales bacterium]